METTLVSSSSRQQALLPHYCIIKRSTLCDCARVRADPFLVSCFCLMNPSLVLFLLRLRIALLLCIDHNVSIKMSDNRHVPVKIPASYKSYKQHNHRTEPGTLSSSSMLSRRTCKERRACNHFPKPRKSSKLPRMSTTVIGTNTNMHC